MGPVGEGPETVETTSGPPTNTWTPWARFDPDPGGQSFTSKAAVTGTGATIRTPLLVSVQSLAPTAPLTTRRESANEYTGESFKKSRNVGCDSAKNQNKREKNELAVNEKKRINSENKLKYKKSVLVVMTQEEGGFKVAPSGGRPPSESPPARNNRSKEATVRDSKIINGAGDSKATTIIYTKSLPNDFHGTKIISWYEIIISRIMHNP